jgi:hypothetical protein
MTLKCFPFIIYRTPLQSINKLITAEEKNDAVFEEALYLASADFYTESKKKLVKTAKTMRK